MSDWSTRKQVFDWLDAQQNMYGDVLSRELLSEGLQLDGQRVPLIGPQGIFKPRICDLPISITSIPDGPYDDGYAESGQILYKYRGTDPRHHENVGLRTAMKNKVPLVYFFRVMPGRYLAEYPVFIVNDSPQNLTFNVQVDDKLYRNRAPDGEMVVEDASTEFRREYITAQVRQRVHQKSFRERVLRAYSKQCAICNLKHEQLLDAAHIIPDSEEMGVPSVNNGMALCKIHHAAFDRMFIGIRPDRTVIVRSGLLTETDGPMLKHGLQGMHLKRINVPSRRLDWPKESLLESRFEKFISQTSKS